MATLNHSFQMNFEIVNDPSFSRLLRFPTSAHPKANSRCLPAIPG